jgi:hypothetical protein
LSPDRRKRFAASIDLRGRLTYLVYHDAASREIVKAACKAYQEDKLSASQLDEIVYGNTNQFYSDDDRPVDRKEPRPCSLCKMQWPSGKPDACLGQLPGVKDACCGHGVEESYIEFHNGVRVSNFARIEYEPTTSGGR